ncbi:MAG: sigma 54-interacting transcriptional regulator [Nitrospira sp.]|nr:sigma 54-interacting transcriptional regulator [Nitrospira sp.]MCC7470664.1 sigma 54-interacting transcriptional regulator [Candidatus Nomurabacteria bacterium]
MGTVFDTRDRFHILSTLLQTKTLRQFDERLQDELLPILRCSILGLYLYSETTAAFSPVSDIFRDPTSPAYPIAQLPAAGTIKEAAVRAGQAILANDLSNAPWTEAQAIDPLIYRRSSVLVAPVTIPAEPPIGAPAKTLAVIVAVAMEGPDAFTEEDRDFLEVLGQHIAPVLTAVLAAEERDTLVAINGQVVLGAITLDNLIHSIQPILRNVIHHDVTGLVRFVGEPHNRWFDIVACEGVAIDQDALRQFPFEHMAAAEILTTGKPLLLTGHNQERFAEHRYFESLGVFSAMLCPLLVRGKPYGFLAIGSKRRNAFSERDLALTEQIGFHLSHAITNLSAYDQIRQLKDQLEQENVYLREEMGASLDLKSLVGDSPALQKSLRAIEMVAPTDSTVLITGETGTGKELVAQAIHRLSPRQQKALITVNCAALPPTLIESELFGHEKGAFTSATARKLGRFELAHGGTIFLDEVGELPIDVQMKLLRVLEAQEFNRVGGTQTIRVDVRVLAATNVDLDQAIKRNSFRADLFYRLNVFPLRLPTLRERLQDIPLLARHFVQKYSQRHRKPVTRIHSAALKALSAYDWPGNVRELEHVIERAVIVSRTSTLTTEDLDGLGRTTPPATNPRTMAEAERAHILETLIRTHWVLAGKQGAAQELGMKRSTLQHRMKKLAIIRPAQANH